MVLCAPLGLQGVHSWNRALPGVAFFWRRGTWERVLGQPTPEGTERNNAERGGKE